MLRLPLQVAQALPGHSLVVQGPPCCLPPPLHQHHHQGEQRPREGKGRETEQEGEGERRGRCGAGRGGEEKEKGKNKVNTRSHMITPHRATENCSTNSPIHQRREKEGQVPETQERAQTSGRWREKCSWKRRHKIRNENGEITTDNTEIQRIIRDYYQQL